MKKLAAYPQGIGLNRLDKTPLEAPGVDIWT
jgi:hypothetical protein